MIIFYVIFHFFSISFISFKQTFICSIICVYLQIANEQNQFSSIRLNAIHFITSPSEAE